jgi:multiphosphoryl transfer protein
MVSIVIVSHSAKLAEGVRELALQMSQNKVKVFAAGGIDDASNPIGTDPFKIQEAIEMAYSDMGILVLMDIGSAIMNTEIATEMLPDAIRSKVLLCEAPLVEGAIAAVAQSMVGSSLEVVAKEAKNALLGKIALLGHAPIVEDITIAPKINGRKIELIVPNKLGLHARPSVKLVSLINKFETEVGVSVHKKPFVSARSISQVGTLGAKQGDTLIFSVEQAQEFDALAQALLAFAADNFGDNDTLIVPKNNAVKIVETVRNNKTIEGLAASSGIAIGKTKLMENVSVIIEKSQTNDILNEIRLFRAAMGRVSQEMTQLQQKTKTQYSAEYAEILEFHIMLLNDETTRKDVENRITQDSVVAAYACTKIFEDLELKYTKMEEIYFRERASDIVEIKNKVVDALLGSPIKEIILDEPCILVVDDIGPAQTLSLDTDKILGILSKKGGETSHATILARSLGIPAIIGIGDALDALKNNELIGMDGSTGKVWVEKKNPEEVAELYRVKTKNDGILNEKRLKTKLPAVSLDGNLYHVFANISSPKEAKLAFENGAEGVGLFRTEFLFMNRNSPPTEEEQYGIYKQVCENMQGLPITIRTLDVGGDKPIPYLDIPKEINPFLGLRGIRYCLFNTDLFKTQLRALCRISADYDISIMYPMIGVLEEVLAANKILKEVRADLTKEGILFSTEMKIGIMVEVPSVIFQIKDIAPEIDFLSIGSNDLTQYLLALDRENLNVSTHFSALHPAVLSALRKIMTDADDVGLEVSICGELARNHQATRLLAAIGIKKFSMSSPVIPEIKEVIRQLNLSKIKETLGDYTKWTELSAVEKALGMN